MYELSLAKMWVDSTKSCFVISFWRSLLVFPQIFLFNFHSSCTNTLCCNFESFSVAFWELVAFYCVDVTVANFAKPQRRASEGIPRGNTKWRLCNSMGLVLNYREMRRRYKNISYIKKMIVA